MMPQNLNLLLAQATGAAAGQTAGQPDNLAMVRGLLPMVIIIGALFFVTWRSNSKRQKEQETLMNSVKSGDKVVTNSGLLGLVTHVREKSVVIRCEDSKLEILKSAIASVEKA